MIFGASGDLTHRLLVPALYNLAEAGLLPKAFALVGVARSEFTSEAFRDDLAKSLPKFATRSIDERVVKQLLGCVAYVQGDPEDETTYKKLGQELARIEGERGTKGNRLFYLATPPAGFAPIGIHLGQSGLARQDNGAWRRVIIEKPFGTDLASARALNQKLLGVLKEDQIFRIDHYLGKETVQNILMFRFSNAIFEPLWNRDHIDHVQITVTEKLGVGAAAAIMKKPARCATWCRTTCSRCCRSSPWNRRLASKPKPCARKKRNCSTPSRCQAGRCRETSRARAILRRLCGRPAVGRIARPRT